MVAKMGKTSEYLIKWRKRPEYLINRRNEAETIRKNRVILGYIQAKYPNVYEQANEYHKTLAALYPEKLDLRRTKEYADTTNNTKAKKRYAKRPRPTKQNECNTLSHPLMQFELHIPLVNMSEATQPAEQMQDSISTTQPAEQMQDSISTTQQAEQMQDSILTTQPAEQMQDSISTTQPAEQMQDSILTTQPAEQMQDSISATETTHEMFPLLTEKMMDDIIAELKEGNPHFEQFFNDIDIPDFDIPDLSPLEAELNT